VNCETRQEQLERIAFESGFEARVDEEREHLEACADCSSHCALLQRLIGEARNARRLPLPPQLRASVHERAARALRAASSEPIFRWNIAAPLAVALLAVPIAIGEGWLWTRGLSYVLEPWLPTAVLTGLTIFYVASAALTLGGLYGLLPFAIAYANRNHLEAP
jgi:hypothetical protein